MIVVCVVFWLKGQGPVFCFCFVNEFLEVLQLLHPFVTPLKEPYDLPHLCSGGFATYCRPLYQGFILQFWILKSVILCNHCSARCKPDYF